MSTSSPPQGLRDPQVATGLRLLVRTLVAYRRDSVLSIAGALLWMVFVVAIPYLVKVIVDDAIDAGDAGRLIPLVAVLVLAGLLHAVGIGIRRYYGFRLSYRAETDLRNRIFAHVQRLGFTFHDGTPTGQLMARASSDLSQVRLVFAMLPITVANVAMLLAVLGVLLWIDLVLGAVAAVMIPVLFVTVDSYAKRVVSLSFGVQQRLADLSQVVEQTIGGIQVVKAYGQEPQEQVRLDGAAEGILEPSVQLARKSSRFGPLFELIPSIGTVAVLWLGGLRVVSGDITFGDFVAFTQYLAVLVLPIRLTGWFFANLPRSAAAATRIHDLFAVAPDPAEPNDPVELPVGPGRVSFDDVTYSYPGGRSVVDGVRLEIPGGTSVALVGATGAGKTTLANLIPRFVDPVAGRVQVDGVDVNRVSLEVLRREVAVVFQETFLFSNSVRDNIALGAPEATDQQVRAAARLARAHDFICRLPDGYDTVVGERGHSLSGGQRQRVALARAVLRDPRILILDDATSSVDAVIEAEIQQALRQVMSGRTTIVIAHRTSTLSLVDWVVFMDHGTIVATGPHQELLETVPRYGEVLASTWGGGSQPVESGVRP